ncbi:serine/threonine-protein kinase, partial [Hansschlegelia beijingensis]|uniref:serine/threonine-protein kinase n=1 Tax=Hansschlegelia beijingensis TaxID=1133344 RepID=UPI00387F26DB
MAKEDSGDLLRATGPALRNAPRFSGADDHLAALSRGTRLFEYRIDAVLGHGGFGITYLAEDTLLREPVAVKEFFPAHAAIRASDQSARARSSRDAATFDAGVASFLDEARIIARVRHPNIVQVRRFFEAHGTGYIVLDFVQGRSLEATLEEAPLPERRVLSILNGVLDGLGALHDRAILHRDLKPRNVILRDDDTPVLIDFGAARDFGLRHSATVTQIVSPNYSPPEQYGIGDQQGPWSDIYSLGAILYRAVTGKVPTDSLRRLRDDPLAPAGVAAAGRYDEALLRLVDALLAIEPAG